MIFQHALKQFDGLTWLTLTPILYDRSTPLVMYPTWLGSISHEAWFSLVAWQTKHSTINSIDVLEAQTWFDNVQRDAMWHISEFGVSDGNVSNASQRIDAGFRQR